MTMVREEAVNSRPIDELTDSKKLSSFIVGSGFPTSHYLSVSASLVSKLGHVSSSLRTCRLTESNGT